MMIMRRLVLIRFPMTYKGRSHQPAQRFRVACAQELRGIFNILSVYFYTPNIMESLMARELFMDIGREIMSMEDCIKCYDNGDNTQQSAPGPGDNIQVWHGSSGSQYCCIAAYCPAIAFPPCWRREGMRYNVRAEYAQPGPRAEVRANMEPS